MASNDVYACRCELTTWDVNHSISFHARDDNGEPEGFGGHNCALAMSNILTPLIRPCVADDTIVEAWYCRRVNTPENPGLVQENNLAGTGGVSGSYPPNTCAVFSFRGEDPLIVRAGRFYLGGLPNDQVNGGVIAAGFLAGALKNLADALEAAIVSGPTTFTPGIWRTIGAGIDLVPPFFVQHDQVVVEQVTYSQRRRTSKSRGMSA